MFFKNFLTSQKTHNRGFGLIEVIVATSIISASLYALAAASQIAFRAISQNMTRTQSEFLAEEGLEVLRAMRDVSWGAHIATTSETAIFYGEFNVALNEWALSTSSPGAIDGVFERELIIESVYRDSVSQDIVSTTSPGAVFDAGTKLVTSRVRWAGIAETEHVLEIKTYLTDLFGN